MTVQIKAELVDEVRVGIGEVARLLNVPTHTIRFWEKEFDFYLAPDRTDGRQRRYSEENIQRLRVIHHLLKDEGYSIAGARRQLIIEGDGAINSLQEEGELSIARRIMSLVRMELNTKIPVPA
jgi:DNA-binding transcriptional MerR regulator